MPGADFHSSQNKFPGEKLPKASVFRELPDGNAPKLTKVSETSFFIQQNFEANFAN